MNLRVRQQPVRKCVIDWGCIPINVYPASSSDLSLERAASHKRCAPDPSETRHPNFPMFERAALQISKIKRCAIICASALCTKPFKALKSNYLAQRIDQQVTCFDLHGGFESLPKVCRLELVSWRSVHVGSLPLIPDTHSNSRRLKRSISKINFKTK